MDAVFNFTGIPQGDLLLDEFSAQQRADEAQLVGLPALYGTPMKVPLSLDEQVRELSQSLCSGRFPLRKSTEPLQVRVEQLSSFPGALFPAKSFVEQSKRENFAPRKF